MRLLLLGCTGFIGSELVPRLIKSGHEIVLVSRKKKSTYVDFGSVNQITSLQANPTISSSWESDELISALKDADGVINLVGEPIADKRWTLKHCQEIKNSRLKTTKYLIQAIAKLSSSKKVLINGSAIGFYGTNATSSFDENSPSGNDFLANVCKEWEANASVENVQTRLVILRIGIVLEKNGGALGKMLPIFKAGFGGPIGSGKQWMSWVHRADLCKIIEHALLNRNWEGVINAVSPNPVTMSEFTNTLGRSLNRPSLLPVPGPLLKALLGDGAKVVLEGQKVSSKRLTKLGFKFSYPTIKDALEAISISSSK